MPKKWAISSELVSGTSLNSMIRAGAGVAGGNAEDFAVHPLLVAHQEHTYRTSMDVAPREGRFFQQHHGVEGIAILGQSLGHVAVVLGVSGGGEEHAIQPDGALIVGLVLVPGPLGDFDHHLDLHTGVLARPEGASHV